MAPSLITTPIYYANGLPHIGHAYTTVAADALTRWHRQRGRPVRFITGMDEHGQKVARAAEAAGQAPQGYCDDMAARWRAAWNLLYIQPDRFIRTTDADHAGTVGRALLRLRERGDIYEGTYEGWYSPRDEAFVPEKDRADHPDRADLVWLTERCWYFRLSAFRVSLLGRLAAEPGTLEPAPRRREIQAFLEQPLDDLCISRPRARVSWGLPIPWDPDSVVYVWFDALLNYLTAGADDGVPPFGPGGALHLVGKDITRPHAVYWPAMLWALGHDPDARVYAHGWWVDGTGAKMGKSAGNGVDVAALVGAHGADAVRYFLLREMPYDGDARVQPDSFALRYNADLANDLGNLVHRVMSLAHRFCEGRIPHMTEPGGGPVPALYHAMEYARDDFDRAMPDLRFADALESVWARLVRPCHAFLAREAPWSLPAGYERDGVLRLALEVVARAAHLLSPLLPERVPQVCAWLGYDSSERPLRLQTGRPFNLHPPLFPRIAR